MASIIDFSPSFQTRYEQLTALREISALSYWSDQVDSLIRKFEDDVTDIDDMLQMLHESQRVIAVYTVGLENNEAFLAALQEAAVSTWQDYDSPPVDEDLQRSLGDKLYNVERIENPYAVLNIGDQTAVITPHIIERLVEDGIPFDTNFREPDFDALIMNHADEAGVKALAALYVTKFAPANTVISAFTLEAKIKPDPAKRTVYAKESAEVGSRLKSGDLYYTLTLLPTEADAEKDGIPYEEYVQLYFEMCDQPWEQVKAAQDYLISKFDKGDTIRITNDDGTDITMSLVDHDGRHFTFANSVIGKNVPGSEIFTAPRRDSATGTVVAKGRFVAIHDPSKIIENLTLHLENGKIVDFDADEGREYFQEFLDRDPNNAYIGELGIGGNPHLGQHVLNGLLVEKIGGSFHLAFGDCYQYTEYEGVDVHVVNGNKTETGDHWDMTTMLRGRGGNIYLDDELVMKNGRWLDPKLAVLNQGWAAIPVNERPDYWKSFAGYAEDGAAIWANRDSAEPGTHFEM